MVSNKCQSKCQNNVPSLQIFKFGRQFKYVLVFTHCTDTAKKMSFKLVSSLVCLKIEFAKHPLLICWWRKFFGGASSLCHIIINRKRIEKATCTEFDSQQCTVPSVSSNSDTFVLHSGMSIGSLYTAMKFFPKTKAKI